MSQTSKILEKIGLTENEVKVYQAVITFNFRTAGQITYYTKIGLDEVIKTCNSLIEKHYLKKKDGKTKESAIYIPLAPKIAISSEVAANLEKQLAALSDNITDLWDKTQGTIDKDIERLLGSVEGAISTLSGNITQLSSDHQGGIDDSNSKFLSSVSNITNKATETFEKQIQDPLNELSKKLTELAGNIENICSESLTGIEEANVEHSSKLNGVGGELKEELDNYVESVALFTAGRISGVTQQIVNVSSETESRVKALTPQLVEKVENAVSGEADLIKNMNDSLPTNVLESYNSANSSISSETSEIATNFSNSINSIKETNSKALTETISSSIEVVESINKDQANKVNSLQTDLLSAINTIQQDAVTNLGTVLTETSAKLDQTKEQIVFQIKNQGSNLNADLLELHTTLMEALSDRFSQVKQKLTDFISQMKSDSENNVDNIISNVNELKNFLISFLTDIKDQFGNYLVGLQDEVKESLVNIVGSTNEDLDSAVVMRKEELLTAKSEIQEKITEFKSSFEEFLISTKTTFVTKLSQDQVEFNSRIQENISEFQTSTEELRKHQEDQITEINGDIDSLNSEAKKIEEGIQNNLLTHLKGHRDAQLNEITNNTNSLVDKFSREFTRFNERLDRELNGFYDHFHDKSQGLRVDVPEKIEGVFLDQVDRLDNFKRDFQRIMGHAINTLNDFVTVFSDDGKKIDKKAIPELFGEVTRAQSDFKMFEQQMNGHFGNTVDDTEDIKNELLTEINKTVQDELIVLEDLVQSQSKNATTLSNEFIQSIKSHSDDFITGMKIGVDEPMAEIESAVSSEILTLFIQPLKSILSKSKAVATGSEDSETENRLLKTQNVMIKKIQSSVDSLNESLKSSFDSTITGLIDNLEQTKVTSSTIVSGLNSNVNKILSDQEKTIVSYKDSLQESLKQVQFSINESLSTNISSTNDKVASTVELQSKNLEDSVASGNADLRSLTSSALTEIDQSLSSFQDEFDTILQDTGNDIKNTIKEATDSQSIKIESSISELTISTGQALDSINQARFSLSDNVSQMLSKTENEVNNMVTEFQDSLKKSEELLRNQVESKFKGVEENFVSLERVDNQFSSDSTQFVSSLDIAREQINKDLQKFLSDYQEARADHITSMKEQFSIVIDDIVKTSSEFIVDIFDQVNTQIQMLQIEIEEYSKSSKDVIQDMVTNSVENMRTSINNASSLVTNAIGEVHSSSPPKFNDMVVTINNLSGEQDSAIQKSKSEFQRIVTSSLTEKGDEWKTNISREYEKQDKKIAGFGSDLKTQILEKSTSGKKSVTDSISKIPSMIDSTLEAAAKSMKLLSEISEGSFILDPSIPELSYFDASKEAILANLNGVIGRSKSSLTIVCPNVSWIDPQNISNFTRVSVKLITDLESHNADDEKIMTLFKEKGINVDLRRLDRNRFRGDINMILASRDKEEVILSKLPTDKAPYAFVSQDDAFIEKFNELLNPFQTMPKV